MDSGEEAEILARVKANNGRLCKEQRKEYQQLMDAFYCCSSFPIFDFNDFEIIELKSIFGIVGECDGYRQTLQTCNDDNFFFSDCMFFFKFPFYFWR